MLVPGDLVRHGLSQYDTTTPNPNWDLMLYTMQQVIQMIVKYIPSVPILPAIGNNDCYYHNDAPPAENATQYYSDMWNVFFV